MKQGKRKEKRIITNCNKLKGLLAEKGISYKSCALELGISDFQFRMKINGKTDFWVSEAISLSKFLGLNNEEFISVFLPHMIKVS